MIFVTGGTGLIGRHILQQFSSTGVACAALARSERAADLLRSLGAKPVLGRVEDQALWAEVRHCSAIVHAAAIIADHASWEAFEAINVRGTALAARRAAELAIPIVHISSVAVYGRSGDSNDGTVGEDFPFGPLSDCEYYARSKRLAEETLWREMSGGAACVLRPCLVYGPADRLFMPRVVAAARRGWLPRVGPGQRPLALVHAASVAEAVRCALASEAAWGRAFNVTNDAEISPAEFIAAVATGLGRPIRTVPVPEWAALTAAQAGDALRRAVGRNQAPSTLTGAVRFWRGGNPYRSAAARHVLGWRPDAHHGTLVAEAVRQIARSSPTP